MRAPEHFGQIPIAAICHIHVTQSKRLQEAGALTDAKHDERSRHPTERPVTDGPDTNARLYAGRDRTGRNGRLAELGRVGFLLNESGADFSKHGWRAFALLMA